MIRIVKNSSQVGDADTDRPGHYAPARLGGDQALHTRRSPPGRAPVHSFDNSARRSPPRACSQGPRPSLGRPSLQARPGAARQPRTPPVEPRRALCSPEPQPGSPTPAGAHAPPPCPASRGLPGLRPASPPDPPGSRDRGGARPPRAPPAALGAQRAPPGSRGPGW